MHVKPFKEHLAHSKCSISHVSSQDDAVGKGSVRSCSCCQWSPVCRDFLPNVHPAGLLSARAAGGDPARPPVSHLGVPAKPEKGPSAWVREKLGTHSCLHGLVPKTKKKESEIFLGSTSDSQMSWGGASHLEKTPTLGAPCSLLGGWP